MLTSVLVCLLCAAGQEEATYATERLADVILDLHHGKTDESSGIRSPPRRSPGKKKNTTTTHSPQKLSSLRALNSSPIARNKPSTRNYNTTNHSKASRLQTGRSISEEDEDEDEEEDDDNYSYDEEDFDEESNLNLSMGNPSVCA